MIQDNLNSKHFTADEQHSFVRKADNFDMGNDMYLGDYYIDGTEDVIENYQETKIEQEQN